MVIINLWELFSTYNSNDSQGYLVHIGLDNKELKSSKIFQAFYTSGTSNTDITLELKHLFYFPFLYIKKPNIYCSNGWAKKVS